eukprot:CAMPEP_0204276584 /NCGR_PEP_ID=MMETSP0468-20130131/28409_1 /ASSEMBLY_ACC=CAM_ASM_000383 /TAXON_ID=2969 /ORGANISM="Oxyrrhis marina" /LENGTH=80 /DNA_ID=CAMNT_0051253223 /DNA_START=42 /DNA_END=284 /DNA_ORIENTATION=+
MSSKVIFNAGMTCDGCSGAITRILKKIPAVEDIKCDLEPEKVEDRTVTVTGAGLDADDMLAKLEKWAAAAGKTVSLKSKE